jgi:hypothetical protein
VKRKSQALIYVLLAIPIGAMMIPTVIVLSVALVPTVVAFLMERKNGWYGGVTVGALNLAGTAPYLADLWFKGHTIDGATGIITSVLAWAVFYGCAALGWAIYVVTPNIVSSFMAMTAGRHITTLRARQRELVQTWGPDVEVVYEPDHGKAAAAATPAPAEKTPPPMGMPVAAPAAL